MLPVSPNVKVFLFVGALLFWGGYFIGDYENEPETHDIDLKSDSINMLRGAIRTKEGYILGLEAGLDSLRSKDSLLTAKLAATGRAIFTPKVPKFKTGGEAGPYLDSFVAMEARR